MRAIKCFPIILIVLALSGCARNANEIKEATFMVSGSGASVEFLDARGEAIPESELSDVAPLGAVVDYYRGLGVAVATVEHSWTAGGQGDDLWRFLDSGGSPVAELRFSNPAKLVARTGR